MAMQQNWFTGQEACRYLGKSDEWLRKKVNAGMVRFAINPSNGRKMYSRSVLDRLVRPISIEAYIEMLNVKNK